MKKAILFGASGFIGSQLLNGLLNDAAYERVTIVVRKDLGISHPKLTTLIGDYQSLPNLKNAMVADEIFIALGTTQKNTPDQAVYYQVDHDYPLAAARMAKDNGAQSVFVVTAVGATERSIVFYIRTKGKLERDMIALDFAHTHIFRPSMIMGKRKESRPMEKFIIKVWTVINPILSGPLNRFRGMDARDIAAAMLNAAKKQAGKVKIYHWKDMKELL